MLLTESARYLLLPISRNVKNSKVRIHEGGQLLLDLDVPLSFEAPESVMYYDLAPFLGRCITVSHESGKAFGFSEKMPAAPAESCRPAARFTADYGWINDPNGLVFYEGKYHLFFQHNPVGVRWGNMHWGHAVSDDLMHWEQLPDALYPDETGDMYSGSAIVDHENLLGLNTPEHEAVLLYYTSAGNHRELNAGTKSTQCLAISTDGAKTFRKYEKNPVVPHIIGGNRDPKVMHDAATGLYLMALYLDGDRYGLFTSKNLTDWKQIQALSLPGDNECPDIFPMHDGERMRWVLGGAHDCYTVCDFDPEQGFVNLSPTKKLGFGRCYAAQSYSGTGARRVRFSWNRYTVPSPWFNCAMSVPCELILRGEELFIAPVKEADAALPRIIHEEHLPSHGIRRRISAPCDISLSISHMEERLTVDLCGNTIVLDAIGGTVTVGDTTMPLCSADGCADVRILADHYGIEIFTGIRDGYARACGAFDAVMCGDALTLAGEGSLDALTIRQAACLL